MKPGLRQALVIGACVVTAGLAAVPLAPMLRLDGASGAFGLILPTDTEYAPGYSASRFLKVHEGMSAAEVTSLLGPPILSTTHGPDQYWFYSRSPNSTHYRYRALKLRNGAVAQILSEFYVD